MKRILIVQSDAEQARDLSTTIAAQGDADVTHVSTVREACLLVAQEQFDVVLVDNQEEEGARRALHALQPDLTLRGLALADLAAENGAHLEELFRLIFDEPVDAAPLEEPAELSPVGEGSDTGERDIAPDDGQSVSQAETLVDVRPEAPAAETLLDALPEPVSGDATQVTESAQTGRLSHLLSESITDERIVGSVLTSPEVLLDVGGALTSEQARAIAQRVAESQPSPGSRLLQFIQIGAPSVEFALFTLEAPAAHYLTLVGVPDIDAGRLRRAAETLIAALSGARDSATPQAHAAKPEAPPVATHTVAPPKAAQRSFALIVQPRRPLPAALQQAVRHALKDVAAHAGCELTHQNVTAELVHIVSTCPAQRGSGWLAQLYKQGVEQRIQDQFGVQAQLWRKGFYAKESDQPVSDVELDLFLSP